MYRSLNQRFINDIDTDIISNGEKYYVVSDNHWNGKNYFNCFEIDKNYNDLKKFETYKITPVFELAGEDDYKIIDYKIEEE